MINNYFGTFWLTSNAIYFEFVDGGGYNMNVVGVDLLTLSPNTLLILSPASIVVMNPISEMITSTITLLTYSTYSGTNLTYNLPILSNLSILMNSVVSGSQIMPFPTTTPAELVLSY